METPSRRTRGEALVWTRAAAYVGTQIAQPLSAPNCMRRSLCNCALYCSMSRCAPVNSARAVASSASLGQLGT